MERASDPPFGTCALAPFPELVRRAATRLPRNRCGRHIASLARKICLAGREDPVDIVLSDFLKIRAWPRSSRCEKVIVTGPQFFDYEERAMIDAVIMAGKPGYETVFADIGANAGYYSLFAADMAARTGRRLRVLAVEPDARNRARLHCNIAASGFDNIVVTDVAVGGRSGRASLTDCPGNRGEVRLTPLCADGDVDVVTIGDLLRKSSHDRPDIIKIDIEGHDFPALQTFFACEPPSMWPGLLIVEAGRQACPEILSLCRRAGYDLHTRTRLNAVLLKRDIVSVVPEKGK